MKALSKLVSQSIRSPIENAKWRVLSSFQLGEFVCRLRLLHTNTRKHTHLDHIIREVLLTGCELGTINIGVGMKIREPQHGVPWTCRD